MASQPGRELSLIEMAMMVVRHSRTLILTPLIVASLVVVVLLIRGPRFAAESAFRPEVPQAPAARFAGLAAQLGVNLTNTTIGDPVRFYLEVAKSRDVHREVALTQYRFAVVPRGRDSLSGNLLTLFRIRGKTAEDSMQRVLDELDRRVEVTMNRDAGLVRVRVVTRWPELSVLINRRILELINAANLERRQSQAGAERRFVETRLNQAEQELHAAEGEQERFLERNREYQSSPQLAFEYNRLQRRLDLRQQVFTTLSQSYEQARIDEVRNTPQLSIIDQPEGSAQPVGNLIADTAMWLLVGAVLGIMIALVREFLARQRAQDPAGYDQLRDLAARRLPLARQAQTSRPGL